MEEKFGGKDPDELFREIFHRCQKLGISSEELSKLSSVKKLRSKKNQHFNKKLALFWFSAIFVLFCAVFSVGSLPISKFVAKIWFNIHDYDLENEMCVLNMPPAVQNIFMPPVDCSICRNLTEIERVTNISPDEFEKRFAYSTVPVIVSDGTRNWTGLREFSFEFFRRLYLGESADGDELYFEEAERECQFFPYQTEFRSLTEVLSMGSERAEEPWYIGWSNCDSKIGNTLRRHYNRPYFLPPLAESTNIDWIFMGKPGYGAHMHIDHVNNPSWQAQIKGSKLWTLEPVPECYNECKTIQTLVRPGEVIVLDTNRWYHKTLITGDELSITIGSEDAHFSSKRPAPNPIFLLAATLLLSLRLLNNCFKGLTLNLIRNHVAFGDCHQNNDHFVGDGDHPEHGDPENAVCVPETVRNGDRRRVPRAGVVLLGVQQPVRRGSGAHLLLPRDLRLPHDHLPHAHLGAPLTPLGHRPPQDALRVPVPRVRLHLLHQCQPGTSGDREQQQQTL